MQGLEAPIIAAVIVSLATLLTVGINVWSARIARREDTLENRSEWLKEKQIRDIEEIIPTLSTFLNNLHDCVEGLDNEQWSILMDIDLVFKVENPSDLGKRYLDLVDESAKNHQKLFDTLWELEDKRKTWFDFDAKRLSIWFYELDQVGPTLTLTSERFHQYHIGIHKPSFKFGVLVAKFIRSAERVRNFQDDFEPFMDADYSNLKHLRDEFIQAKENWPSLDSLVLEFQKTLANKYKPVLTNKQVALGSDGLLVQLARHTEKGVRWLLRLK